MAVYFCFFTLSKSATVRTEVIVVVQIFYYELTPELSNFKSYYVQKNCYLQIGTD